MIESNESARGAIQGGWPSKRSVGDWIQRVGTVLTDADRVQLARDFGCIRIKTPGAMFTMDFRPGRLNVNVDKAGVIFGFSWG